MVEAPSGAGYPARQVEIEEEILPEAFPGDDAMPGDDFAQRRQRGRRGIADQAASSRLAAIWAASRNAAIRLSARAVPRPAMANAVP
jgi:hypothetical protein